MRRNGALPAWADPAMLSGTDAALVTRGLRPLIDLLQEFRRLSRTSRRQRRSEFEYRVRKEAKNAESELVTVPNPDVLREFRRRVAVMREELRDT
jgi:hypothetical protein